MPTIPVRLKGLRASLASIAADLFQDRFGWLTDFSRVVWYYTATSYAILARRDVLETFEAGIQDATVTAGQPMVAGASGRYQTQDAATFRATIDAVNRAGDSVEANFTLAAPNTNGPTLLLGKGSSGRLGWLGFQNPDMGSNQKKKLARWRSRWWRVFDRDDLGQLGDRA